MPKYLVRVSIEREGVREILMKKTGTGLRAAVAKLNDALGGTVEAYYFAFGEDDVVGIAELPDNVSAAALSVAANAAGFVRLRITPLITVEEMDRAIEKSAGLPVPGRAA